MKSLNAEKMTCHHTKFSQWSKVIVTYNTSVELHSCNEASRINSRIPLGSASTYHELSFIPHASVHHQKAKSNGLYPELCAKMFLYH